MVTDILHDMLQGQPCLWGSGDDLISWQDKTVAASVPQLEGKGVFDSWIVGPVNATPAGLIWADKRRYKRCITSKNAKILINTISHNNSYITFSFDLGCL